MKFKLPLTLFCLFLVSCEKGDVEIFDSRPIFSSSLSGKWVLVNYWAVFFVNGSHGFTDNANFFWFGVIILNTAIFDSVAYFIGSNFGTTFIVKKISPNKTLEGLIGIWSYWYSVLLVWS